MTAFDPKQTFDFIVSVSCKKTSNISDQVLYYAKNDYFMQPYICVNALFNGVYFSYLKTHMESLNTMKNCYKTPLIQLILVTFIFVSVSSPAYSTLISSDELLSEYQAEEIRSELLTFLDRDDVQEILIKGGVDPDHAKLRVQSMTDMEVAKLNHEMENLPVGQGILEVALIILLILVITEILGFTDFSDKIG